MRLRDLHLNLGYSSSSDSLLDDFYIPTLSASISYDRSAGFFSSAIFALAPIAFADFVGRGGKIRLICSPRVSRQDVEAIRRSSDLDRVSLDALRSEIRTSLEAEGSVDLVNMTAALIRNEALQIRVCVPEFNATTSMYHDKVGIFGDGSDSVMFLGSANETAMAWSDLGNHEDIEVMKSWHGADRERIDRHTRAFDRLWVGGTRKWRTLPVDRVNLEIVDAAEEISLTEAMARVRAQLVIETESKKANAPSLLDYQREVLSNWRASFRGIVTFATGGGKTFVGLSAVQEHVSSGGVALILVPTLDLQAQWHNEIVANFPDVANRVMLIGGGAPWRNKKQQIQTIFGLEQGKDGWVFVATYGSAVLDEFLDLAEKSKNLLVVADEVHNAGTPTFRQFLDRIDARKRLGLSATPDRYGDPEGSERILSYFGDPLQPPFTIADGIRWGRLTPYTYDFALVSLTDDEQEEWNDLSQRIGVLEARARQGESDLRERRNRLLQERSRIAKKARNKVASGIQVLEQDLNADQRWLVYCQDREQLTEMKNAIAHALPRVPVLEFHSGLTREERRDTLNFFANQPSIICAINCLDEGIDVPASDAALVLASSTNPRQYIQRRGRILRASKSTVKGLAHLRDVLVLSSEGKLLTVSEAERAREFAGDSNSFSVQVRLDSLIREAGFNADETSQEEQEGEVPE
jgi:superfamily II DNA or RNA helicase